MGLANLFNGRGYEERTVTFQSLWGAGIDAFEERSWSGRTVGYDKALTLSTVYSCTSLLVDDISTLPAGTFIRQDGERRPFGPRPLWLDSPDDGVTWADHLQQVVFSILLAHGACVRIFRNPVGEVVALVPLNPLQVEVVRNPVTGRREFIWDRTVTLGNDDMIYLPRMVRPGHVKGVSALDELGQSLGLTSALDEFAARFFANGSNAQGIIETPATMTPEQAAVAQESFERTHRGNRKAHRTGILGGGSKWVKTGIDPEQAQMLESRQYAVQEIARVFRVPLHMLQVAIPGVQSYASNEQNEIQYASHTLRPIVSKIETAYSRLIQPREAFLRLNMEGLQRGDIGTRYAAYSQGLQAGFLRVADVRRVEDLSPIPGGDVLRVPLAAIDINAAALAELEMKVQMYRNLHDAGVEPEAAAKAVGLPPMKHTGLPSVQLQPDPKEQ
jgi:HK97 family phage portal protein